jgi:hypothetical protein
VRERHRHKAQQAEKERSAFHHDGGFLFFVVEGAKMPRILSDCAMEDYLVPQARS